MMALTTICIPVTKTRFLLDTLRSVRQQVGRVEVIIVDNVADGDVSAIIREARLANYQLVSRASRLPPVENWNDALSFAQGDRFILLSDDDCLAPDHIEHMNELFSRHPKVRVAHSRIEVVDERGATLYFSPVAPEWESAVDFLWHRVRGYRLQYLSDFTWDTATLREIGGFANLPSAWGTDDLTALYAAGFGGIAFSGVPSVKYRVHGGSITGKSPVRGKIEAVAMLVDAYRNFCSKEPASEVEKKLADDVIARLDRFRGQQVEDLLIQASWSEFWRCSLGRGGLPSKNLVRAFLRRL